MLASPILKKTYDEEKNPKVDSLLNNDVPLKLTQTGDFNLKQIKKAVMNST